MLGYDDSLDGFGVHGVGGIVGAVLTGVFAVGELSAATAPRSAADRRQPGQVMIQVYGIVVTLVYTAVVCFILLKVIDVVIGLRVSDDVEREGLDLALHGETVQ